MDHTCFRSKFINIEKDVEEGSRMPFYSVWSNKEVGLQLGTIYWHGRQFVFEPSEDTIWWADCLRDVLGFMEKLHKERAELKKLAVP